MVLDMSAGLIMAGTPPIKDTAVLTSLKLLFSFSSSSLNSTDGESGPFFQEIKTETVMKSVSLYVSFFNSHTVFTKTYFEPL